MPKKTIKTTNVDTATTTEVTVANLGHGLCQCGCGEPLEKGRRFRQGHDARFAGRITKLEDGRMTWEEVKSLIQTYAIPIYEQYIGTVASKPKTTKKAGNTETPKEKTAVAADLVKTSNECHEPLIPVKLSRKSKKLPTSKQIEEALRDQGDI